MINLWNKNDHSFLFQPIALLLVLSNTCTSIGKLKYTDEFLIFITKIFLIVSLVGIGPW